MAHKVIGKQTVSKHLGATPEKVILAIDGATKCGYAIWCNGIIIESGTKKFNRKKRLIDYYHWLIEVIGEWEVTEIVAENIYREHNHLLDKTLIALAKMQGIVEMVSGECDITPKFISPLAVKHYMINGTTRNRAEDKQRMINRVTHLGYTLESEKADDEADAIGIMLTYLNDKKLPITHPKKR